MRNRPPTRPVPPAAPSVPADAPPLQLRVVTDGEPDVLAYAKLVARILTRDSARTKPSGDANGSADPDHPLAGSESEADGLERTRTPRSDR